MHPAPIMLPYLIIIVILLVGVYYVGGRIPITKGRANERLDATPVSEPIPEVLVNTPPEDPNVAIRKRIADPTIPLADRLNLRYPFADIKFSEKLKIMSWKNYAGKRMQCNVDSNRHDSWKRACTLIEDSLHDTKRKKDSR